VPQLPEQTARDLQRRSAMLLAESAEPKVGKDKARIEASVESWRFLFRRTDELARISHA
jgi:hypothetical protein